MKNRKKNHRKLSKTAAFLLAALLMVMSLEPVFGTAYAEEGGELFSVNAEVVVNTEETAAEPPSESESGKQQSLEAENGEEQAEEPEKDVETTAAPETEESGEAAELPEETPAQEEGLLTEALTEARETEETSDSGSVDNGVSETQDSSESEEREEQETEERETEEQESETESESERQMIQLPSLPAGEHIFVLRADELGVEGAISSLEAGEHFEILAGAGTAEVSEKEALPNSCGFGKYLEMTQGSVIKIKSECEVSDIWVYASAGEENGGAISLLKEDGSSAGGWNLESKERIDLKQALEVTCDKKTEISLTVTPGSVRIYGVVLQERVSGMNHGEMEAVNGLFTPSKVNGGTVPLLLDMDYLGSKNGAVQSGNSCAISFRKEGGDWIHFDTVTDENFVPYFELEANSLYEFSYVVADMKNTPYVRGTLTTGETEVTDFTITEYNSGVPRNPGDRYAPRLYSPEENPVSEYGEGSYLYLGAYYRYSNTSGVALELKTPAEGLVKLYLEDGSLVTPGWLWNGCRYTYYLSGGNMSRTLSYCVEGTGYKAAKGTITVNSGGNQILSYTEDEEHKALAITKSGSNKLVFELETDSSAQTRVVNVTIANSANEGVTISLYDAEGNSIEPVKDSGTNPAVFTVEVPDASSDGSTVVKEYRYEMAASGYSTFTGSFGIDSNKKLVQINGTEDENTTVNYHLNEDGYRVDVSLIPKAEINGMAEGMEEVSADRIAEETGSHVKEEVNADIYYKQSLSDQVNKNHFNAESFTTTGKLMITNTTDCDWEVVGYYCSTKTGGDYNHDTTLRVINPMNCDLYGVPYFDAQGKSNQGALTMKQLVEIEGAIETKYAGDPNWQDLFGQEYTYYNYLVYWYRNHEPDDYITGDYSNITSLAEVSPEDFSKIIYPDSGCDVWYNYASGYRSTGMTELELNDTIGSGKVYQSVVNHSDYAPLENDHQLDELIKALAYEKNYSFALNGDYVAGSSAYKEDGNTYVTWKQYEEGVDLQFITDQLGTDRIKAGETLILDNMKYRVEVNGKYSNVFQERDYWVDFGLYFVPVAKFNVVKTDEDTGNSLSGAAFQLTDESGGKKEFITDGDGKFEVTGLRSGTYTLQEVQAPAGYLQSARVWQIQVTAMVEGAFLQIREGHGLESMSASNYSGGTLTVTNRRTSVIIRKTDDNGNSVTGAGLKLTDKNGNPIPGGEWTTDGNGRVFKGLTPGEYLLSETSVPEGYVRSADMVLVLDGTEDGKVIEMTDPVIRVSISKTDKETGKGLAGASLVLKNAGGEVKDQWVSTEEPHVIEKLPAGIYILTETAAPQGYLKAEDVTFEVTGAVENILVTMEDVPSLPSGNTNITESETEPESETELESEMESEDQTEPEKESQSEKGTEKKETKQAAVNTGDSTEVILYLILLAVSAAVGTAKVCRGRSIAQIKASKKE